MSVATTAQSPWTDSGAAPSRLRRRRGGNPARGDTIFDDVVTADAMTLDDLLVDTWTGLSAHRTVNCPVCHGTSMRPRYGAGEGVAGGRCADCGTVLG